MAGKRPLDSFFNALGNIGNRSNYVSPWGMGPKKYGPLTRKLPPRESGYAYEIAPPPSFPPGVEYLHRTIYGPSIGAVSDEASQIYVNRIREQFEQMTDPEIIEHFNRTNPSAEVLKLLPPDRLARILNRTYKNDWIKQNP